MPQCRVLPTSCRQKVSLVCGDTSGLAARMWLCQQDAGSTLLGCDETLRTQRYASCETALPHEYTAPGAVGNCHNPFVDRKLYALSALRVDARNRPPV